MKQLLMGNEAIAMGAIRAGVNLVCGYPGTPSTEVLETAAKKNDGSYYIEWSVNEKAALEVAAGASYAGARTLVTMKQVGLNVASDPIMSLSYVGIKGGMVVLVADDPGPISSQTEQDTREFGIFSKIPVFDPSTPQEAYLMMADAFEMSEKYNTPVIFRPTTRVCHGCADIEILENIKREPPEGFIKDTQKWVIFPRTSYLNHIRIEERNAKLTHVLSADSTDELDLSKWNKIHLCEDSRKAVVSGGVSRKYVQEYLDYDKAGFLEIGISYPFPEQLVARFLEGVDEVLVIEELSPFIEREITYVCGKYNIKCKVLGKLTKDVQCAGENTAKSVREQLTKFGVAKDIDDETLKEVGEKPELPVRPPVLCAGCPHRASFYAVKQAMKEKEAVFCGDIGCYTLGNAKPLDMTDTCLCMGADVTIAQGLHRIEPEKVHFSFIGDSTFFASGITGVVNAVYNETDIVLIVLDNSTTAMTGHQPHPGTGVTMMDMVKKKDTNPKGEITHKISIEAVLKAVGVVSVEKVNPFELDKAIDAVKRAAQMKGVKAIIFKSPCIAVNKPKKAYTVSEKCIKCRKCINEIGCPAVTNIDGKIEIDSSLCFGCGLCSHICPVRAIEQ